MGNRFAREHVGPVELEQFNRKRCAKKMLNSTFMAYGVGWFGGLVWFGIKRIRKVTFTWFKESKWHISKAKFNFWPNILRIAGAFGRWGFFYPGTMCFLYWYRRKHDIFNVIFAGYVCGFQSALPRGIYRAFRGGLIGALFLGLLGIRKIRYTSFFTQYKNPLSNIWMRLNWKAQENKRLIKNLDITKRYRSDNLRLQEENELILEVLDELNKQNIVNQIVK